MTDIPPASVLLVASLHLANPGRDMFNLTVDDVRRPRRQTEIDALVRGFARFSPTKVLVEFPAQRQPELDVRYSEYCAGLHRDDPDEISQIGFRLASLLDHDVVYAVDADAPHDDESLDALLEEPQHRQRFESLQRDVGAQLAELQKLVNGATLLQVFRHINEPQEVRRGLLPYIRDLASVASPPNYAGPDSVATWYRRNLRIYSNIRAVAAAGDRLFTLFGAGHVAPLRHFFESDPTFALESPLEYLGIAA